MHDGHLAEGPLNKRAHNSKKEMNMMCTHLDQSPTKMDLLPQTFDTLTNFYGHLQALGVYTIIHIYMYIYKYMIAW